MAADRPCATCGTPNPPEARFCASCGASLSGVCARCGAPLQEGARFCASCGASVEPREQTEERKVVSAVFADLVGFTTRSDRADPEDVQAALRPYYPRVKREIERLGGRVEKYIGDAVVGLFGAPLAREDDAERAVRAALGITAAIQELNNQHAGLDLAVRVAVNTGEAMVAIEAIPEHGEGMVAGDVMNTASRLQSAAPVGQVVVGELTYEATRHAINYEPLDAVSVKGKSQPVPLWLATSVKGERDLDQRLTPLVGRQHELELLLRLWDQAVDEHRPHLVTILGPPGIGKSRLVREVTASIESNGGRVLRGRCRAYGETTGYEAFGQQVQQAAGILETDPVAEVRRKLDERLRTLDLGDEAKDVADHLAVLLGLPSEASPDKTVLFYSARRFAEAIAREQPSAFLVEDIHWAGPPLLDLLESLAARCREIPLLLITNARPGLLDVRATWGGGLPSYAAVPLEPLAEAASRQLARQLVSPGDEAQVPLDSLVETSGGNPLFIEELASSLAERATGAGGMPATVQAIIAARLDGLPPEERRVLQDASVIGGTFWRGVLASLGHADTELDESLDRLELRDFVRRQPTSRVAGDREFVFKHILTREVAYGTLPRARRRGLHAQVAAYIERVAGDRAPESASILAYHWRESGEAARALPHLLTAAEVASRAWAKQSAVDLYTQAIDVAEEMGDAAVVKQALLDRARAGIEAGDQAAAAEDLERLLGGELTDEQRAIALFLRSRAAYWLADAVGVKTYAQEAAAAAQRLGNADIEARALAVLAELAGMEGDLPKAIDLMGRSASGWPADSSDPDYAYGLGLGAVFHYWRGDYQAALDMGLRGFDLGTEAANVAAVLQSASNIGMSLVGLSRIEEGLEWYDRGVRMGRELEPVLRLTGRVVNMWAGALREVGDLQTSRALSAEGLEMGRSANFPGAMVSAQMDVMCTDLAGGDIGQAEKAVPQLMEVVAATKGWHQWLWGGRLAAARAEIALASGRFEEAVVLAMQALEKAGAQRRLKYLCRSRTLLGEAMFGLGRLDDAAEVFRTAVSEANQLGHAPSLWGASGGLSRALDRLGRDDEASRALADARGAVERFAAGLSDDHERQLRANPSAISLRVHGTV